MLSFSISTGYCVLLPFFSYYYTTYLRLMTITLSLKTNKLFCSDLNF
jgi:hypothetical protein